MGTRTNSQKAGLRYRRRKEHAQRVATLPRKTMSWQEFKNANTKHYSFETTTQFTYPDGHIFKKPHLVLRNADKIPLYMVAFQADPVQKSGRKIVVHAIQGFTPMIGTSGMRDPKALERIKRFKEDTGLPAGTFAFCEFLRQQKDALENGVPIYIISDGQHHESVAYFRDRFTDGKVIMINEEELEAIGYEGVAILGYKVDPTKLLVRWATQAREKLKP